MSRSPLRYRLIVSAASFLLSAASLEAGLRIWMPSLNEASFAMSASQFELDPHTGYRITLYAVIGDEVMNRDGFRGPDRPIPKPPTTYRILAVGDSVVQAIAGDVRYEQTWERRLETSLNSDDAIGSPTRTGRYEVINAGVSDFAARHPDVILMDAARGFEKLPPDQRVRSFVDSIHLSVEGNDLMARVVARTLRERGIVP